MLVKLVNIADKILFSEYSDRYKIFRDLYDPDSKALEFINVNSGKLRVLRELFISKKFIFYNIQENDRNNFLVLGDLHEFNDFASELSATENEEIGNKIFHIINNYTNYDNIEYRLKNRSFKNNSILIAGILNITPDSFSDGGKYLNADAAVSYARRLIESGVDIIDVGGESTRPGSEKVSAEVEMERVIPVIERIAELNSEIIISVDTTKSAVAREALKNGAAIVNDISAGTFDSDMFSAAAEYNAAYILMHIKGKPKTMQDNPVYGNLIAEIYSFLLERMRAARQSGINNIIIDPGIGFGKRLRDNYTIIKRLSEFKSLGSPILIGLSRKSFLGNGLQLTLEKRETPTIISETFAVQNGARIIRTHNAENALYLKKLFNFYSNPRLLED
jgi:dihydropteroate synthase